MRTKFVCLAGHIKSVFTLLLVLALYSPLYAQEGIKVSGTVTDAQNGQPLPGVTVKIKNNTGGTMSDSGGKYSLSTGRDVTLIFSYIGYASIEKKVSASLLNVQLQPQQGTLNDVVVVGYGSQSKSNLASATSSISEKDYKNAVITNLDQALQGRVTGVQVTPASGEPGANAVIRIRGNNSLSGDNQPLYVVDGFPMPTYVEASANATNSFSQNGLYGINPNDIESVEVLKDASATAIYGSRGANGVILIKTKSGKSGEAKIELVNKTTAGSIRNPYKMIGGEDYAEIINAQFPLLGVPAPFTNPAAVTQRTDWFDAVTQTSIREDATLNVSGGNDKTSYYLSGNYLYEKGNVLTALNKRGSVRANINTTVNDWYSVKAQLSLVRQNTARAVSDSRNWPYSAGPIFDAIRSSPLASLDYTGFQGEGIPGYTGLFFSNPVNQLINKTDNLYSDYTIVNFENNFKLVKDLQLTVNVGSNQNLTRRQLFFPPTTAQGFPTDGNGSNNTANTYSYNANAYLSYNRIFKTDHQFSATGGVEWNKQTTEMVNTATAGFAIPGFGVDNIGSALTQSVGSYKEDRTIESAFFRANYVFKRRYVLNASIRLDGASPFADNKKYGTFPAIGLAWNAGEEDFMKNISWIQDLKLRGSYGETGSQAISPYSSLSRYNYAFYQTGSNINTAMFPASLGNQNLSWERTRQWDGGIDFNLAKGLLSMSFDYYNKTTLGLLQPRQLPSQSGFDSIIDNYGTIRNTGVELSLQANIANSDAFKYTTKITVSHNKNVLKNLGEITAPQYASLSGNLVSGVSGILQPGKEIGLFYGQRVTGLVQQGDIVNGQPKYAFPGAASDQVPGAYKYEDVDGDGVINTNDRQVLGNANPKFTYSWNHDFTFKKFGINLFFTGSQGNDVLNLTRFYVSNGMPSFSYVFSNQTQDWFNNRWTPSNPTNDPKYPGVQRAISLTDINSAMIENGSYFRLKSATIYYSVPDTKVFRNARVFLTGTNLFTITKYTGFDPEVSSYGQSLLQQGIDFGSYPAGVTYTIGLSANF